MTDAEHIFGLAVEDEKRHTIWRGLIAAEASRGMWLYNVESYAKLQRDLAHYKGPIDRPTIRAATEAIMARDWNPEGGSNHGC